MMAENKLLPCPFCGNLAQIKKRESAWKKKTWFSVRCVTSQCYGHPREPNEYDTKEKAIKAWNRRVKMTEKMAERIGYSKGYEDGRKELAKMMIKRFDPDRPPISESAYYYKDEIIEIIKETAGVDDESKA